MLDARGNPVVSPTGGSSLLHIEVSTELVRGSDRTFKVTYEDDDL
jgi:hypothetical protein